VAETPDLGKSQVESKKNAGTQKEKNKPLVATQVTIQEQEELIDLLHASKNSNYLNRRNMD